MLCNLFDGHDSTLFYFRVVFERRPVDLCHEILNVLQLAVICLAKMDERLVRLERAYILQRHDLFFGYIFDNCELVGGWRGLGSESLASAKTVG